MLTYTRAALAEQGASASQMDGSGQIFWTRFVKLRGIGGEGSDALLSVHDAPRLVR